MADDTTFFSIAAALLPTLVFAGLLSDKLKPPERTAPAPGWALPLITVAGLLFILAEVTAIAAAIYRPPGAIAGWIVAIALIVATVGAVILVLWPWINRVDPAQRRAAIVAFGLGLSVQAAASVVILIVSIDRAELADESARFLRQHARLTRAHNALWAREIRLARRRNELTIREMDLSAARQSPHIRDKLDVLRAQAEFVEHEREEVRSEKRRLRRELRAIEERLDPAPGLF